MKMATFFTHDIKSLWSLPRFCLRPNHHCVTQKRRRLKLLEYKNVVLSYTAEAQRKRKRQ